jgi:hypothetical protein
MLGGGGDPLRFVVPIKKKEPYSIPLKELTTCIEFEMGKASLES